MPSSYVDRVRRTTVWFQVASMECSAATKRVANDLLMLTHPRNEIEPSDETVRQAGLKWIHGAISASTSKNEKKLLEQFRDAISFGAEFDPALDTLNP